MHVVLAHYATPGPNVRERVLEALNALAIAVAYVVASVPSDDQVEAYDFFASALEQNLESATEHIAEYRGAHDA